MSQEGRTQYFAFEILRSRGEEKNTLFPSCRAPREISRSPRLAQKAPVMQANVWPARCQA